MSESSLALLLFAFTAAFLCAFWFAPGGVLALRSRAGEWQVDVRPAYSPDTLFQLLERYGAPGRRSFRTMLLADMLFPAIYAATLYVLGDLLNAASPGGSLLASLGRCAGIAAAAFDYLENLFLLHVLRHLDSRPRRSARLAGIFTTLKTTAIGIAAVSFAAGWIILHTR
jgi:MFS family permease